VYSFALGVDDFALLREVAGQDPGAIAAGQSAQDHELSRRQELT
jgi:hypothetical protein